MKKFCWIILFIILSLITVGIFPFIYCIYKGIKNKHWKYAIYPIIFISIFAFSGHAHSRKNTIDHVSKSTTTSISIKKSDEKISKSISSSLSKSESESKLKESMSLSESQSKLKSESESIADSNSQSIAASVSKSNEEASSYAATTQSSESTTTTSQPEQTQQPQNTSGYTNSDGWSVAQSGWCFVSNSNIYYSRVKIASNFKYTTIDQAVASGARIAKRGNQYAQP